MKVEATFHLTACVGYLLMVAVSVLLPLSSLFSARSCIGRSWCTIERFALDQHVGASVILFYAVCQHDLHADWKFRIRNLPMMVSIGVGMCISNAKAVLQGIVGEHLEFYRTPKYSRCRQAM